MHNDAIKWQGEIVPTSDPYHRLCQFDTMQDGVRAAAKNLLSYFEYDDCKTISEIIMRYAPFSENPTDNYIAYICKQTGMGADDPIDLKNPITLRILIASIVRFEQGSWVGVPYDVLTNGVDEAYA